ncbi:MAG TPA: CBS domain-containing protein [Jiangellales bacterium]|nr:CBS domain-containing protein [Jiangellales bacterium]
MRTWEVGDVMTVDVASVHVDASYREVVDAITGRHISGVPVVDSFRRVLGVVSETDLLYKVERLGEPHERRIFEGRRRRDERVKTDAIVAGDLMTAPAVTVHPSTSIVIAAKLMASERVGRLPVVNDLGRLVGIVAPSDMLRVHLRSDADIRQEILDEVLGPIVAVDDTVSVQVENGVVRLAGQVDRSSTVDIAGRLVVHVAGIVAVVNELRFATDDSRLVRIGSASGVGSDARLG